MYCPRLICSYCDVDDVDQGDGEDDLVADGGLVVDDLADVTPSPEAPICECCGLSIDVANQSCPALDDGRCSP